MSEENKNQEAPEQGGAGSILVGLVGLAMLIYAMYVFITV